MTADSTYKITDQNDNRLVSSEIDKLSSQGVDVIYSNIPNLDIEITKAISGDKNKPLYIICDNLIKIETSADMSTGRPIVVIYNGSGNFWINCNGDTFTGDIYAPFGSVSINDNHHLFYGSIEAGNRIQLQSQGYYIQRNYTATGSGGSGSGSGTGGSGAGSGSVSYRVNLVNISEVL